jgi:hypothetical protein
MELPFIYPQNQEQFISSGSNSSQLCAFTKPVGTNSLEDKQGDMYNGLNYW